MNHAEVSGLLCVGMHETDGGEESFVAEYPKMDQDTSHERTKFDVVMATSTIYTDHINTNACLDEYHMSGDQPVEEIRFGSTQPFELQSEGMVADSEEESMPSSPDTSSTSNYDMPGYMEQNLQHIYNSYDELVDKQGPVVLSPAFITCDETVHLEPQLTFSLDGIKIEYLDLDSFEDDKLVALQWEISNIISIDCKWTQSVGSALITLIAGSEAERGIPDPIRVQFCLDDSQWPRRQQKIWDLGPRYQEIWKDISSDDFTSENWSIEPCLFFPRQYFSSAEDFEDVIYPQGDPDAVSISKRDVELLLPETFVNDTIIDFYIKYLSTRIEATEKCRYHFFNSFFFRKLAGLDKDQGRAPEGREAFLRVRKWTRKISVFDKDFLFIPVNFNLHWSLIVICYPGEVTTFEDGDIKLSAKVPCILHMDSLKGSHTGLKDIIQSYLWEEWKERHPESASDNSDKFLNLRFVSLELPQQDNSYDCGLFLLHYVELFLTDAPSNFNPLKIDVFSGFLSDDWFAPPEASLKRSVVRKLIHELVTGSFQNHPKLVCGGEQLDERHQRCSNAEQEPTREFHAQICSAGEPETVCTVGDGTHEIQPSKSCSNDSKEKELPTSGCMLDTGRAPIVDVQNLLELEVCAPDKDTVVCLSSQDEKNEPLASNSQLNMRSYAPEDEVFKESNRVVTDEENKKSLFLSLDNNQKIGSQAEVEVQDIMVSTSCSISEIFAQEITSKEQSLKKSKKSVEVGDECFGPCQGMDYVMTFDSSKDDDGPSPQRMTAEEDCCDPHEGINSVKLVEINKNVVDNAIVEDVKSISRTEDNVNHSELYVSLQLPEGNADNGMTGASTASSYLKEENIDKVVAGHSAEESNINANGSSELKIGNISSGTGVGTASSDLKEENVDKIGAGDSVHESDINAKDSYELKVRNTDNGITGSSTISSDLNEGNTDEIIAGDCINKTNLNAAADEGADKYLAKDSALPCEEDATCTDGVILSLEPCSMKNETVSKNTTSDAKMPLVGGTCELVARPCTPKNEMSESTSFDGKRPAADGTCEENELVIPGDAKTERRYERRKVLALEKQRSFSEDLKIGNTGSGITGVITASSDLKEENIDKVVAGDSVHESGINAKDSSELKVRKTDNGITGSSTVSSDLNEGNTDEITAGDCINKTNLNAADEGADKYLAKDSALPCEEDVNCTDGMILSLEPCSMKNETVSKNTTSDAKIPLAGGTCELVGRPCTPNNEMSESTSFDGKRPASDGTCEENELVIPGDAKTERCYKRRKVLALEKQRSFSGANSTD